MLAVAVVVHGDGARADVAARPDVGIAEIGQVVGLGALGHARGLQFHEVADMDTVGHLRPRADARKRPDQHAPADAYALDVAEGVDDGVGPDGHAGTEADVGPDPDIGAELRVGRQPDRAGIGHRDPARHRGGAQPLLQRLLGRGQFGARIDALELGLLARHGDRLVAGFTRHTDRVGEVEFALHIVVAEGAEQRRDQPAVDAHDAGIGEGDRSFCRVGVPALHDLDQLAVLHDEPAVGRGIAGDEAQHAHRRPCPGAGRKQLAQAGRRHQRRIAEHDQDRPFVPVERLQGGPGRMSRSQWLALDHRRMGHEGLGHLGGAGGDHADDARGLQRLCIGQYVGQHGAIGQGMQDLRQRRFHTGPGAGCEHDHGNG